MPVELKEFSQEEAFNRKVRQKKRIRGCLIVLNALLLCYFSYLVVDSVVDKIKEKNQILNSEIIQLNGKSSAKSKELYDKHISSTIDVNDFATYGKYLTTSSSRVTYQNVNYSSNVWLADLLAKPFVFNTKLNLTLGESLDEQIDLFALEQGDYMLCHYVDTYSSNGIAYHYTGEDLQEVTLYSFPDEYNHRTKISIKGKASSPALIISVEKINLLPSNQYDFVIIGDKEEFDVFQNTNYQVKYVSSLKEAYLTNASYALVLKDEGEIVSSNYLSVETSKPNLIKGSVYNNLDEDNAIRELGGYIFNAGYGVSEEETNESISSSSLEIKSTSKEVRRGKYTLSINKETTLEQIKSIIGE